jgi:hypothetical protein
MKNMNQDTASGGRRQRGISANVKFAGRGAIEGFFHQTIFSCKDLLPEKRELSRVLPEFTCKILRNDCTKPSKISAKLVN